jgi:hypothetical protein
MASTMASTMAVLWRGAVIVGRTGDSDHTDVRARPFFGNPVRLRVAIAFSQDRHNTTERSVNDRS